VLCAARRIVGPFLVYLCAVTWLTWPLATHLWNEARLEPVRQLWRGIATTHDRPDLELLAADVELMLFRVTGEATPP
jgi:hypothetical protein